MGSAGEQLMRERSAFRSTLHEVGPDAATACGEWTSTDLAVHVALGEVAAGWTTAPSRLLVARGVRLDRLSSVNARVLRSHRRRHGFDWAMRRLAHAPPRVQTRGAIATVSLLEVWAHHEDVLVANGLDPCGSGVDLEAVAQLLVRYQARVLRSHGVRVCSPETVWFEPATGTSLSVAGEPGTLARWLSGRQSLEGLTAEGDEPHRRSLEGATLRL